jgi:hypothetical protein
LSSSSRAKPVSSSIFSSRTWAIAAAILPLAGFAAFLLASEILVRRNVVPMDYFEQHLAVFRQAQTANVVLGDSVAGMGLEGHDQLVNLAFPGESPLRLSIKARRYFADRAPGHVLIEAHFSLLNRDPGETYHYDATFGGHRPPLRILEPRHRDLLRAYWGVLLGKGNFDPLMQIGPHGMVLLKDAARYGEYLALADDERRTRAREAAKGEMAGPAWIRERNRIEYRHLVEEMTRRGARVCLVMFPVAPAFAVAATGIPEHQAARRFFVDVAAENHARLVDYWTALEDLNDFANETHLSRSGAAKLSRRVERDCYGDSQRKQLSDGDRANAHDPQHRVGQPLGK